MANPYTLLGVRPEDPDETIRQHYLDAVRRFPPDRCPEQFHRYHGAYERIKDVDRRLEFLLFDPSQGETLDELVEEERCRTATERPGLNLLLGLLKNTT
jgi:curved DNA-binding protein CbpA